MSKTDPVPRSDAMLRRQLLTFARVIPSYAEVLGVTAAQIASQAADAAFFDYMLRGQQVILNGGKQWTTSKDLLRRGEGEAIDVPPLPVLGDPPPAVRAGIEQRFRRLIRQIKAHGNYNPSLGEALGIEGAERTTTDIVTVQPELTVHVSGGAVHVGWSWLGNSAQLDMIELRVDRSDGRGPVFLAQDTTPGYVDTHPLPAEPAKWTYTAIFWLNDRRVGQWSTPASVLVGG